MSEKLKVFAGNQFDVALNVESEPQDLLPQIEDALKAAGWIEIGWNGGSNIAAISFTRKDRPIAGISRNSRRVRSVNPDAS